MNKFKKILILSILFLFYSLNLNANGLYTIAKYGITASNDNITKKGAGAIIENESEGYMVTLGIGLSSNWGTEVMYYDLGETTIKGKVGEKFLIEKATFSFDTAGTVKNSTTGYGTGVRYMSSTEGLNFYAKAGMHVWDRSGSTTLLNDNDKAIDSRFYNDGADLYFGFGINYQVFGALSVNASYDAMDFGDTGTGLSDMGSMMSLGLKFDF